MYDQNPLLHKLNIDDLAKDYQDQMNRKGNHVDRLKVSTVFAAIAVIGFAVIATGSNFT